MTDRQRPIVVGKPAHYQGDKKMPRDGAHRGNDVVVGDSAHDHLLLHQLLALLVKAG
jgi:hypothetical protein